MRSKLPKFFTAILLPGVLALIVSASFSQTPTAVLALEAVPVPAATQPALSVEAHFAPEEQLAPIIVKLIDGSEHSLDIAAFAFTHPDIADAVVRAHERGVQIRLVMDLKNASGKSSRIPDLIKAGIEVRIRHKDGDQHSKYLVIDQAIVVTGSFNFTARANERNSENVVVIRNAPKVVEAFSEDYRSLLADSRRKDD